MTLNVKVKEYHELAIMQKSQNSNDAEVKELHDSYSDHEDDVCPKPKGLKPAVPLKRKTTVKAKSSMVVNAAQHDNDEKSYKEFILNTEKIVMQLRLLSSPSLADKLMSIEVRNMLGHTSRQPILTDKYDKMIEAAFSHSKVWYYISKHGEYPTFYKCYICYQAWWHLYDFRQHVKRHMEPHFKIHFEDDCQLFSAGYNIIAFDHSKVEVTNIPVEGLCWQCYLGYAHHISNNGLPASCEQCKEKLQFCSMRLRHFNTCPKTVLQLEPRSACPFCTITFKTKDFLSNHMQIYHSVRSDIISQTPCKSCLICKENYIQYNVHCCSKKKMKSLKNFCIFCDRGFPNSKLADIHCQMCQPGNCPICSERFKKSCMITSHIAVKHSANFVIAYKCLLCAKFLVFLNIDHLRRHIAQTHGVNRDKRLTAVASVILPKTCFEQNFKPVTDQRVEIDRVSLLGNTGDKGTQHGTEVGTQTAHVSAGTSSVRKWSLLEIAKAQINNVIKHQDWALALPETQVEQSRAQSIDKEFGRDIIELKEEPMQADTETEQSISKTEFESIFGVLNNVKEEVPLEGIEVTEEQMTGEESELELREILDVNDPITDNQTDNSSSSPPRRYTCKRCGYIDNYKQYKWHIDNNCGRCLLEMAIAQINNEIEHLDRALPLPETQLEQPAVTQSIDKEFGRDIIEVKEEPMQADMETEKSISTTESESKDASNDVKEVISLEVIEVTEKQKTAEDSELSETYFEDVNEPITLSQPDNSSGGLPKLYTCKRCGYIDVHKQYRQHITNKCQINRKYKYNCSLCSLSTYTLGKYFKHLYHHGIPRLSCPVCKLACEFESVLSEHMIMHIRRNFTKIHLLDKEKSSKLQCRQCMSSVEVSEYFTHWESHLAARLQGKSTGAVAVASVDTVSALEPDVLKALTGPKVKECIVCKKHFLRHNDSKRHIIEHLLTDAYANKPANKMLKCQICGDGFDKPGRFKHHMRIHGALTLYKCELCDKSFSDSSNFSKHKKIHNMKVFVCDICSKKFVNKSSLEKHILDHRKCTPTNCQECNKVFYSASAYRKHMKAKHSKVRNRYRCVICNEKFDSLKKKWDHLWLVHKERKNDVDCNLCDKSFRRRFDLWAHLRNDHQIYNKSRKQCHKSHISGSSLKQGNTKRNCGEKREEVLDSVTDTVIKKANCCKQLQNISQIPLEVIEVTEKQKTAEDSDNSSGRLPKLYTCKRCGYVDVHKQYRQHITNKCQINRKYKYNCTLCSLSTYTLGKYFKHLYHHGIPRLSCPVCKLAYKLVSALSKHMIMHIRRNFTKIHLVDKEKSSKLQCRQCMSSVEVSEYFTHWESHLAARLQGKSTGAVAVASVDTVSALEPDVLRALTEKQKTAEDSDNSSGRLPKLYTCKRCGYIDVHKQYRQHITNKCQINSKYKYNCTLCSLSTYTQGKYFKHLYHHGIPWLSCPVCKLACEFESVLSEHMIMHIRQSFTKMNLVDKEKSSKLQCRQCMSSVEVSEYFTHWESHLAARLQGKSTDAVAVASVDTVSALEPDVLKALTVSNTT